MNCPLCGEICRCHLEPVPSAVPRWIAAADTSATELPPEPRQGGPLEASRLETAESAEADTVEGTAASGAPLEAEAAEEPSAWRNELSDRLNRYRARRKAPPPRYPSLMLRFDAAEYSCHSNTASPSDFDPISINALALDGTTQAPDFADTEPGLSASAVAESVPQAAPTGQSVVGHSAKIIEFPRFAWGPPPPPPDQLAGPVTDRPRILDVPDVVPPPPALGGITIEAAQRQEADKRPGIDFPLQSASLPRRMAASTIDSLIVATASALFGAIFWKVAAVRPPLIQILGMVGGVLCLFWATYQYLLLVYAATTPGLLAAKLELTRFNGSPVSRSLRRWRVVASYLSAASLGMGYVWVLLDEDGLCWHDRITHTHLAPRKVEVEAVENGGMLNADTEESHAAGR
jgi:hypothetical protein